MNYARFQPGLPGVPKIFFGNLCAGPACPGQEKGGTGHNAPMSAILPGLSAATTVPSGTSADEVPSPCRKKCRIDEATGRCEGCLRTLDEIVRWRDMDSVARQAVWAAIRQRAADGPLR